MGVWFAMFFSDEEVNMCLVAISELMDGMIKITSTCWALVESFNTRGAELQDVVFSIVRNVSSVCVLHWEA